MYFESGPWYRKRNFQLDPEPAVLEGQGLRATLAMEVRPRATVTVTLQQI